jgi:hypothetical protein
MFKQLEELLSANDDNAVQFVEEHSDEVTDELVAALEDTYRILRNDLLGLTFH